MPQDLYVLSLSFAISSNDVRKSLVFNKSMEKVGTTAGELPEENQGVDF